MLTTLIWAGNVVIARGVADSIPPVALSFWRSLLALLIVAPLALRPLWRQRQLLQDHWKWLVITAVLSVGLCNTLLYIAAQSTEATNIGLINSAMPVIILVLSHFALQIRLTPPRVAGVVLGLSGILLIISQGSLSTLTSLSLHAGDLVMLLGIICWSVFSILLKLHAIPLRAFDFLAIQIAIGTLAVLPFYLLELWWVGPFSLVPEVVAPLAYVAFFQSIVAYGFWSFGVRTLGPQIAGTTAYLIPVFVALLAWLTLGEPVRTYHLWGGFMVLTGVYLATRRQ